MIDVLVAALALSALVALGLAVLAALTLVPFVLGLQVAESRGLSSARWGAVALAASVLGLLVVLAALRAGSPLLGLLGVPVCLAGAVLPRLVPADRPVAGRAGRHE